MKQQPVTENSLNFLLAIIWLKRIWLHIYTYKHPFQRLGQNPSKCKRSSGVPSLDGTPELLFFTFPAIYTYLAIPLTCTAGGCFPRARPQPPRMNQIVLPLDLE